MEFCWSYRYKRIKEKQRGGVSERKRKRKREKEREVKKREKKRERSKETDLFI